MAALDDIVRQGKARYVGVSNFRHRQIEEAMRLRRIDVVQYAWNMFDRRIRTEIFSYCAAQQIGVIAYGSLAYGILSGAFHAGMQFEENDRRSRAGNLGSLNLFRSLLGRNTFHAILPLSSN
jgi:aryl-alcohol dehydrogenase-like predicted oxidoreductase